MSRFNTYFANDFSGCRLLAYAYDPYRERQVRVYHVPGEWSFVGVTDGVDKWIAPVSINPFSVNVARLLQDLQAGKPLPKPVSPGSGGSTRRALLTETQAMPTSTPRKTLLANPSNNEAPTRSRRVLQA